MGKRNKMRNYIIYVLNIGVSGVVMVATLFTLRSSYLKILFSLVVIIYLFRRLFKIRLRAICFACLS